MLPWLNIGECMPCVSFEKMSARCSTSSHLPVNFIHKMAILWPHHLSRASGKPGLFFWGGGCISQTTWRLCFLSLNHRRRAPRSEKLSIIMCFQWSYFSLQYCSYGYIVFKIISKVNGIFFTMILYSGRRRKDIKGWSEVCFAWICPPGRTDLAKQACASWVTGHWNTFSIAQ